LAGALGASAILGTTPVTQGDTSAVFRLRDIAGWVSQNLYSSVVPLALLGYLPDGPYTWTTCYRGLTSLYFSLFTGALTLSLTAFLVGTFLGRLGQGLRGAWRRWRGRSAAPAGAAATAGTRPEWAAVWLFLVLGTLGAAALHPGKIAHGIAHSACF